ncbi:HEAT repeat domain-containing protein [Altericista sp. CCNU0014]|uniref:HEAT repeat domain-containing protein n=1 Tax=Altericista sp. CCNU0014 TaxID=3082949 RepID=UPI00384CEC0E
MNPLERAITTLERMLLHHPSSSVKIAALQNLARIGQYHPINLQLLYNAAEDPNPNISIAALAAITDLVLASFSTFPMSDQPKVQMTFNAPVYGAAGTVAGDQIINASAQDFDTLLNDYKQFFNDLQQKYPVQIPEAALLPIIDAEFQELQKTQPQRWQNFLNLKRLWNGGKKATFKLGEHFTEENLWGKMAIAFLEGIAEDPE